MKLFKYALLLVVLVGFVSVATADITTSMTGTQSNTNFVIGYNVTCTATDAATDASYAVFEWNMGGTTMKTMTIPKDVNKYVCTLLASDFTTAGQWRVSCQEYDSSGKKIPGKPGNEQFRAVNGGTVSNITLTGSPSITATATVSGTTPVTFNWYKPDGTLFRTYTSVGPTTFSDTCTVDNTLGSWKVTATQSISTYSQTFDITLPEFPIGSFIPMLLVGVVYIMLRRNMAGF